MKKLSELLNEEDNIKSTRVDKLMDDIIELITKRVREENFTPDESYEVLERLKKYGSRYF